MENQKINKYITGFLGFSMFTFGMLKFVSPFKDWYTVQIVTSEMPFPSYAMGIAGEILTGLSLLFVFLAYDQISQTLKKRVIQFSGLAIVGMMLVALYVHIHPDVPAEVLPLKIKPPIIPLVFVLISVVNVYLITITTSQKIKS